MILFQGEKVITEYSNLNYERDLCPSERRLAIECDENNYKHCSNLKKMTTKMVENELGYFFIRYN